MTRFLPLRLARRMLLALIAAGFVALAAWPGVGQAETAKQVALTAKQLENFMIAAKALAPLLQKLEALGGKPDQKTEAAIEAVVKKHGFADYADYENVDLSIAAVFHGVDPKTKQYSDPIARLKKELAQVQADKSLSDADRKRAIEEIEADLAEIQPVQHPGNIALVLQFYDRLMALLQEMAPSDGPAENGPKKM